MLYSKKLAYLQNGTYDQSVVHLEREAEIGTLGKDGEQSIPTMTAVPPNDNPQKTD